ncbi:MAG TPA: hypothetical protein DC049_20390 [Spirochaetia bacterium]|nr:hypothetical protein [Spirochaetia bacterium]
MFKNKTAAVLGGLLFFLIYLYFFSSASLIKETELLISLQGLEEKLEKLEEENSNLRKTIERFSDPQFMASYFSRYGYGRGNEILLDIILPELPADNLKKPVSTLQKKLSFLKTVRIFIVLAIAGGISAVICFYLQQKGIIKIDFKRPKKEKS